MPFKGFDIGSMNVNAYVLWEEDSKNAYVIDPGYEDKRLLQFIQENQFNIKGVLLTHAHADHIGGVQYFLDRFHCKLYVHPEDLYILKDSNLNYSVALGMGAIALETADFLNENDIIKLAESNLKIIHTPGHSPGGICIYWQKENVVFSGDTLFFSSIGRTDFEGGNYQDIIDSIQKKLFSLPDDTTVCPGHGQSTTISYEKANNPYAGLSL